MIEFTCPYCLHGVRDTRERVDAWFKAHYDPYDTRRCPKRDYERA